MSRLEAGFTAPTLAIRPGLKKLTPSVFIPVLLMAWKGTSKGELKMRKRMTLHVNDSKHRIETDTARSLLNVLRDELSLTGSKYGCGEGQCGACTVLIDGRPRRSCITPVGATAEKQIATIESMEKNGQLHPLQEAFMEKEAMQCGYCTAGMIMSGVALLEKNQNPSENEIVQFMNGNICRCGTYPRIVDAIRQAARVLRGGAK